MFHVSGGNLIVGIIAALLETIGSAFLSAFFGKVSDEVWTKLKEDPAKITLEQALGYTIQHYATSSLHLGVARPFHKKMAS